MISFLDLATTSGVCWGRPGERPTFDTWLCASSKGRGQVALNLTMFVRDHLDTVKPDKVFIEAPMEARGQLRKGGASMGTTIVLQGLILVAEMVCHSRGIPTALIERQEILGHFTGRRTYPSTRFGKDGAKKATMARCTQLRWSPADYDQADAGAGWFVACAMENPRMAIAMGINAPARITRPKPRKRTT
jgi:hypothetical protein